MSIANVGDDNEGKLRKAESGYERLATWGGALVIFGLVIEVVLTAAFAKGQSFIEEWGPVGADALIALGVAGEVLFAAKARSKAEALKRISDEKVAEANVRAAEAKLETERLRAQFAWRMLSLVQISKLLSSLMTAPPAVEILYFAGDPDSQYFAMSFETIFRWSGWTLGIQAGTWHKDIVFGLVAPPLLSGSTFAIVSALNAAEIPFSAEFVPRCEMTMTSPGSHTMEPGQLYVGPKQPVLQPTELTTAEIIKRAPRESSI